MLLEREEGRERNIYVREKHDWLPLVCAWMEDPTHNSGYVPWPGIESFGYVMVLQPTEPHRPGLYYCLEVQVLQASCKIFIR